MQREGEMRASKRVVLGVLAFSAMLLSVSGAARAQSGGQCQQRPPCAAHQVEDVSGCCVDSPGYEGGAQAATKLRWSSRLLAHHLTTQGTLEPRPQGEKSKWGLSSEGERLWEELIGVEVELIKRAAPCQELSDDPAIQRCLSKLEPLHQQREALILKGQPLWEEMAKQGEDAPTKDHGAYYAAIGGFALKKDKEAVAYLKGLSKRADQTPYAAWAVASMGDFFYGERAYTLAQPMYLRVGTMTAPGLQAYASMMRSWCAASSGQGQEAFREIFGAVEQLKARSVERQLQGELLWREIFRDLALIYAHVGDPKQVEALVARVTMTQEQRLAWLVRLAQEYSRLGAWAKGRTIYEGILAKAGDDEAALSVPERATLTGAIAELRWREGGCDASWSAATASWLGQLKRWQALGVESDVARGQWEAMSGQALARLRICVEQDHKTSEAALMAYRSLGEGVKGRDELYFTFGRRAEAERDVAKARAVYTELAKVRSVWQESARAGLKRLEKKK